MVWIGYFIDSSYGVLQGLEYLSDFPLWGALIQFEEEVLKVPPVVPFSLLILDAPYDA